MNACLMTAPHGESFCGVAHGRPTCIEIGNPWSNQDVAVWYENSDGSWSVIRSGFSLWNYLGTLATTVRMQPSYYLFPKGFVPA